jgi:hypothetical protein
MGTMEGRVFKIVGKNSEKKLSAPKPQYFKQLIDENCNYCN